MKEAKKTTCPLCKQEQTKIQRVEIDDQRGNIAEICENKDCCLCINIDKVSTWIKN